MEDSNRTSSNEDLPWLSKIFLNPIILDYILDRMSFDNIKILRATCTKVNEAIVANQRFLDSVVFAICENEGPESIFYTSTILERSTVPWKNVTIYMYDDLGKKPEEKRTIMLTLKNLECLKICDTKKLKLTAASSAVFLFRRWKVQCDKMTNFTIDYSLISYAPMKCEQFLNEKTKLLDIQCSTSKRQGNYQVLTHNLKWISERCKKLETFTFYNGGLKNEIFPILHSSANSLTSVCLKTEPVSQMKGFEDINLPKLKIFLTTCRPVEIPTVLKFLTNQKDMKKITVMCTGIVPENSSKYLRPIVSQSKKTLKSFHLMGFSFEKIDWEYLAIVEDLQYFSFTCLPEDKFGIPQNMAKFLPESLQSLQLHQMALENGFREFIERPAYPFENMLELNLMELKPSLKDCDLQAIFSKMTNLRLLKINDAPLVTNYGITGIQPIGSELANSNISVANLKKLLVLKISLCPNVTNAIQHSLKLQSLREIALENNDSIKLTADFLISLVTENPLLHTMTFTGYKSLPEYNRCGFIKLRDLVTRRTSGRCSLALQDWNEENERSDSFECYRASTS